MNINQWRDTSQVIGWSKKLECKSKSKFIIQVNIKEYYHSRIEETLHKAIPFTLPKFIVISFRASLEEKRKQVLLWCNDGQL